MIMAILFCVVVLTGTQEITANVKTAHYDDHPDVIVDSMWVNYDHTQEGKNGMLIHLKFTVYSMKEIDCAVAVYFNYDFEKPLKDKNQKFYTTSGNVAVFTYLKPKFDIAEFKDLQIFMPYDELDLTPGTYKLKMDVDFNYDDGTRIQHLKYRDFNYTQPSSGGTIAPKPTSVIADKSGLTKKELLTRVRKVISEVFHVKSESVKMQNSFKKDLGGDDLDVTILFMEIDEEFGIMISDKEQVRITTVQHLYDFLVKRLKIDR